MKKIIKITFLILVIFCMLFNMSYFSFATQENNEEKSEEETKMDNLQLEKADLQNDIDMSNNQIIVLEDQMTETIKEIAEINQKMYDKQIEIETIKAKEIDTLSYIERAENELEKSTKRYNKLKSLLENRLVAMYEMGNVSYFDLLLNSRGITEFLSNYYLISEVTSADQDLLQEVEAEKKYNTVLTQTLDEKKVTLQQAREEVEKNEILLGNMNIIKNNRISQLSEDELELERQIEEYQEQVAQIEKEIRVLALKSISAKYVGGTMAWPVPGYTRITSPFGMRTHPITGVYKLHTGVDIGAPMGATFVAANDGIVTYAGQNRAYGNMVIIDHGGGITTLYAHGSKINVSVGQIVSQGQSVLNVGSTGYSTGPHAHFEVRINGKYVEPLDYITSYSSGSSNTKDNSSKKVELN